MFANLSNASTYAVATPRTPRACLVTIVTRDRRSRASRSTRSGPSLAFFVFARRSNTRSPLANLSRCSINFPARCLARACAANERASRPSRAPRVDASRAPSDAPSLDAGSNLRHCRTVSNARARGRGGIAPASRRSANAGSNSNDAKSSAGGGRSSPLIDADVRDVDVPAGARRRVQVRRGERREPSSQRGVHHPPARVQVLGTAYY